MKPQRQINQEYLTGERPLFGESGLQINHTLFGEGESPLKECHQIEMENSMFQWKYPLWYSSDIEVKDSTWAEMARAGVWYTNNIHIENALIEAPKNFRRCSQLKLDNVFLPNAAETLWNCSNVTLNQVCAKGDYFAMNCTDMQIDNFELAGNYCFDGAKNVEIHHAKMLSKDAFWNSENVTVYDSYISGEYLGWNSKNLTLVNCTIESLQGMCYVENLVLKNCRLLHTTLAFEYSTVNAEITGKADSILKTKGIVLSELTKPEIIEKALRKYGFKDWESMLASVGHGGLKEGQVINKLSEEYEKRKKAEITDTQVLEEIVQNEAKANKETSKKNKGGIVVKGIHDVAVRFSKCCNPVPGDEIVGFVTRGRGISIHRTDCINILNFPDSERARLIEAEWESTGSKEEKYGAEINIFANNRTGLIIDISRVFTEANIDVMFMNSRVNKKGLATINMGFDIHGKEELNRLVDKLRKIEGVTDIMRATG